jgi:hypothetical protein
MVTTQYARGRVLDTIYQHWKSRYPSCNVKRRNEVVTTKPIFSDTPAVDSGAEAAQLLVGYTSLVADEYGIETNKGFLNTLEDNNHDRGAVNKLISECVFAETSTHIKELAIASSN